MFEQKYCRELEAQVNSKECEEAFERLKKEHPIFNLYSTVESLVELLKAGNKNYAHKDEIMAILLTELHRSSAIYPIINVMFWDSLHWLYCQRRTHVPDPEELFSRIQWDFYHSLINHNLERLPRKIDVNVFLNTKKKVIAWERDNILYNGALRELENLCKAGLSPENLEESRVYPEEMEAYLLDMVYRKVINEVQYDLILETLVYKRMNQWVWAEKRGIPYNTVRSIRYRAEMTIRQFEDKREKERE